MSCDMGTRFIIRTPLAVVLVVLCSLLAAVGGYEDEGSQWGGGGGGEGGTGRREGADDWFLLQESKRVVRTDAGDMRLVRGFGGPFAKSPMHIGFITMEPRSLFIPQYIDSSLIIFIQRGEARVGHIYKDELVERDLKIGDIYRIAAGSAFYLVNNAEGQRLHVICSVDTAQSLGWHTFQSFFIGGGTYPTSILSGFDHLTLSTAFNVSESELGEMLTRQQNGPIVYLSDSSRREPSVWSKFLDMGNPQKLSHMRRVVRMRDDDDENDDDVIPESWSFRKLLISLFRNRDGANRKRGGRKGGSGKAPNSYNIYDRKPDYRNNYGWSIALDESDYSPLRHEDIGVYLVNLTAGAMMAPHVNPRATEYGIVLRGAGTIQIVYPNGSLAMNAKVKEGDVFWIPRYFPFCQIASRTGAFEFFGFTTSARNNRPQFLVGANSLLQTMRGPELATAFGMSEERLQEIIYAQRESVILPSATVAPPDSRMANVIRSLGDDVVMEFN